MKKQQKGKKGGAKKKEEKTDESAVADDKIPDHKVEAGNDETTDAKADAADKAEASKGTEDTKPDVNEETKKEGEEEQEQEQVNDGDEEQPESVEALPTRKPSLSLQSRQRSESFRKQSTLHSPGAKSPSALPPLDSESEVQEVYRKQATRIEVLEKENRGLREAQDEQTAKLSRTEDELERLREDSGQIAELRSKATTADERAKEVEKLVCQFFRSHTASIY